MQVSEKASDSFGHLHISTLYLTHSLPPSPYLTHSLPPFPPIPILTALHSLVFLARPLGSQEGTVYDSREHLQFSVFFESPRMEGKSGIAVILDSMKRFADDWRQQTMGCWSLVNISLIPKQKRLLIKLGGERAKYCERGY